MGQRVVEVAPERYDRWRARFDANNVDGPQRVAGVERFDHDPLALVLVRRGGYAVGLWHGGSLTAHKTGTRYVQSRTAAGGWSQQRFARRRGNQADELVGAVADHAARLLRGGGAAGLVLGGDRALGEAVLDDDRLAELRDLPRRGLHDLPDPRLSVLERAAERGRAVRVTVEE
ncbi:acVLRF1 family peptidyl-tRNA hydrolase [Phycicoccus flavus]|uniref:acVLRF1 family peptidyl-tRNA hydrolase n=1 Tax=Phycicoccus flavus TaxID=2502783 RepID=UPI000FEB74B3|nr:acVLRF1 family peptidyl-tRNA hydrolase [Phycicoccus flavus]NHA69066.1 hypothetical protein [Phycicoccus flavus]